MDEVRARTLEIYDDSGSVDATATALNLSISTVRALLELDEAGAGASRWSLEFPAVGPPAMRALSEPYWPEAQGEA